MSDADAPNPSNDQTSTGPTGNWRDMRRAERDARREAWRSGRRDMMGHSWGGFPIGGAIIILIGVVFLLGNFGFHLPPHWWAVLLLIPAVGLLVTAIRFYRMDSTMSGRVVGPAVGGVLLLGMALALFFGLNWGLFWPIILIVVGIGIVVRRGWR